MAKAKTSLTAVERRAEELDTIAAVLPMERRDELAELLTDKDVETVPPASTFITGEKSSV